MAGLTLAQRTLPDGRVLVAYRQVYNALLTVSSPASLASGFYDDGW